ncbi:hypothetical protein [Kiloniella sp. EL199]|uniref:hypothetical protein n=1 Tax=Kiloniella sp. EL199 TaxID=2107581 RepID=UPI000EA00795|nr:hypothetical protein [Kiloniella sp. EL199]
MTKTQQHTSLLTVILLTAGIIGNTSLSYAKELSPAECPVQISEQFIEDKSLQSCEKHTSSNNRSHYYITTWASKTQARFSSIFYQPLRGFRYWADRPEIQKEDVKKWEIFEKIKLDDIVEIPCTNHTCFSFLVPENSAECLWFDRDLERTGRLSGEGNENGVLRGFLCRSSKDHLYTTDEAMKYLTSISAK